MQSTYGWLFAVNATSGELLVRGPIDYEQHSEYSLMITARDGVELSGVVRLSSRVRVTVRVTDVNDCVPYIVVNSLSPHGLAEVNQAIDLRRFIMAICRYSYQGCSLGLERLSLFSVLRVQRLGFVSVLKI